MPNYPDKVVWTGTTADGVVVVEPKFKRPHGRLAHKFHWNLLSMDNVRIKPLLVWEVDYDGD